MWMSAFILTQPVFAEDSLSISASSDSVNIELLPDFFETAAQTFTASTTYEDGYTITMKAADETNELINIEDSTLTIPTITLPAGATSVTPANFGYGYGYSVNNGANFKPAPDPSSLKGDILFKTSAPGENTHTLTWGAKVTGDTLAGTYKNSFIIEVTANVGPAEEYYHEEQVSFDGTSYLDTGVALFSEENAYKDFIVKFTIDEIGDEQVALATIFTDMDESGAPYPGALFRYNASRVRAIANSNEQTTEKNLNTTTGDYVLKRETGVVSYSTDGGETFTFLNDYNDFSHHFNITATFGGAKDGNGNPFRLFNGKISKISVQLTEPTKYAITYHANGGTGTVPSQALSRDTSETLTTDTFVRSYYIFDHWNTKPDGSGTSYQSGETIFNLAEAGENIDLYAIWEDAPEYQIAFHSNTNPEEVKTQDFIYSIEQTLDANTFTNGDARFVGWNTAADNSGISYDDEESVLNLTTVDGDVIDFYAIWSDENFFASGETIFNGPGDDANYLDTGIRLFDETNINRDFIISFEITNRPTNVTQATIMSAMDESGSPWPGMVYRVASATSRNEFIVNASTSVRNTVQDSGSSTTKVRFRRAGTLIYEKINTRDEELILDMAPLATTFDTPLTFGASLKADGTPQRYFSGTLSNIEVLIIMQPPNI